MARLADRGSLGYLQRVGVASPVPDLWLAGAAALDPCWLSEVPMVLGIAATMRRMWPSDRVSMINNSLSGVASLLILVPAFTLGACEVSRAKYAAVEVQGCQSDDVRLAVARALATDMYTQTLRREVAQRGPEVAPELVATLALAWRESASLRGQRRVVLTIRVQYEGGAQQLDRVLSLARTTVEEEIASRCSGRVRRAA